MRRITKQRRRRPRRRRSLRTPAANPATYPKVALTKIEILPSSIAIRWSALQPAAGSGGNFCRWASGGLDLASANRQFRQQNCVCRQRQFCSSARRTGTRRLRRRCRTTGPARLSREGLLDRSALELSQRRLARDDQNGMQLRAVPWRGCRQKRIQVDAARLRSGNRLLHTHSPGARATHRANGTGEEFDSAETYADDSARRRKAFSDSAHRSTR